MMVARIQNRESRHGFTLIEVLVVVAIIALLIAILLPALSRARAQGRNALDLSNLRQFALATQQYTVQYSGHLPRGGDPDGKDHWTIVAAREMGIFKKIKKVTTVNHLRVDQLEIYHCPERAATGSVPWVGYTVNAFNPEHAQYPPPPASGQRWPQITTETKIDVYPRPSDVIFLACAETEGKLNPQGAPTGWGNPYKCRLNWEYCRNNGLLLPGKEQQLIEYLSGTGGGIDALDAWAGAHLPQGKSLNRDDSPNQGYRRVARKLHLGRFTNAAFLDGHGAGVPFEKRATPLEEYLVWLRKFGLTKTALAEAAVISEEP